MADRPDENYEMRDRIPEQDDDDYDDDTGYRETSFSEPGATSTGGPTISANDFFVHREAESNIPGVTPGVPKFTYSNDPEVLRQAFARLEGSFGSPIRAEDSEDLFRNCEIEVEEKISEKDGRKLTLTKLKYKGKYVARYVKKYEEWHLIGRDVQKSNFYAEFERAKKKYDESFTKQATDEADTDYIPENVTDDIRQNVIDELGGDLPEEFMVPPNEIPTQTDDQTSNVGAQTKIPTVEIEDIQGVLKGFENLVKTQKADIRKLSNELNLLRVSNASGDAISRVEVKMNNIQEKLKKAQKERDDYFKDVVATNEKINTITEEVKGLRQTVRESSEATKKALEMAERDKKAALSEALRIYYGKISSQTREEQQKTRDQYWKSYRGIRDEFETLEKAINKKHKDTTDRLTQFEERLRLLHIAHEKQHELIQKLQRDPDTDLTDRETGGNLSSILGERDRADRLIRQIFDENTDPDDVVEYKRQLKEIIPGLKVQLETFKTKAARLDGFAKRQYEGLIRLTEREIDIINLKLDRKVEYQEAKLLLKEEVENHPQVRWEKFKKWLKEKKIELGSATLSVGSFIAAMITVLRKTIQTVAKGAYNFGKSLVKVLSKLGPVFSALGNIVLTALSLLSKGLMWLGNNLWLLLVLVLMFLWNFGKKYFEKK